jgi:hypothetical protein
MSPAELRAAVSRALYRVGRQRFLSAVMLAEAAQADIAMTRGERVALDTLLPLAQAALDQPRREVSA